MAEGAPPRPPHVVLVGLMGVGKTSVGRRLADRLGCPFVDADDALAERTGQTVRQWFLNEGEDGFRDAEAGVLHLELDRPEPVVLAAGGGVVVRAANRKRLQRPDCFVVWLDASPAFLASRARRKGRRDHRPLLDAEPEVVLAKLHAERQAWYQEVADARVDVEPVLLGAKKPKATLADQLAALVRERTSWS